jgi:hypothetical protein
MMASGKKGNLMEVESATILMARDMKVNGLMESSMATASKLSKMESCTKEFGKMASLPKEYEKSQTVSLQPILW